MMTESEMTPDAGALDAAGDDAATVVDAIDGDATIVEATIFGVADDATVLVAAVALVGVLMRLLRAAANDAFDGEELALFVSVTALDKPSSTALSSSSPSDSLS
jgi:hypothetical protein